MPRLVSTITSHYLLTPGDQGTFSDDQVWSPSQLQPGGISSAPYPAEVRNYAETTPYQLQAALDDASVVSEDPKYGCEAGCLYCGQPCARSKFGHVFHQCPEHYRWWRMHLETEFVFHDFTCFACLLLQGR